MSILDILFNAAGGGVLGSALHCVTDYFDTKNKVTLLNAQVNAAEKTAAWNAFQESQKDTPVQIPVGTWPWVASLDIAIEAFRGFTRPALTWASVAIIVMVYIKSTPDARAAMNSELLFGSFTAIFWWFGARYAKNK